MDIKNNLILPYIIYCIIILPNYKKTKYYLFFHLDKLKLLLYILWIYCNIYSIYFIYKKSIKFYIKKLDIFPLLNNINLFVIHYLN